MSMLLFLKLKSTGFPACFIQWRSQDFRKRTPSTDTGGLGLIQPRCVGVVNSRSPSGSTPAKIFWVIGSLSLGSIYGPYGCLSAIIRSSKKIFSWRRGLAASQVPLQATPMPFIFSLTVSHPRSQLLPACYAPKLDCLQEINGHLGKYFDFEHHLMSEN